MQNSRIEAGDDKSACSAKMFSFFVVVRSAGMMSVLYGCSRGYGEMAMTCAPRDARFEMVVSPSGVNAPY